MVSHLNSFERNSTSFDPAVPVGDMTGWRRWLAWSALAGLYMIAVGMNGANALQSLGLVVLIGASLPFLPDMLRRFAGDPLAIAVGLFFVYLVISAANATWEPGSGIIHWDRVRKMSRVLLVPVVAYWLAGRRDRIERLFLCVLAGMLVVILEQIIRWGDIAPLFSTERVTFRLNPIWMGLNASILILGLIALRGQFERVLARWISRSGTFFLWLFLLALMLQVVIVSQSRGAYLALMAGVVALGGLKLWVKDRSVHVSRTTQVLTGMVFALAALVVATQFEIVANRVLQEQETIRHLVAGEFEGIPATPIGKRIYMWTAGLDAWMAKPWMGWGPDGAIPAIARADLPEISSFDHLHNGPLDVLVRFGVVGAVLFYAIPFILLRSAWRSLRKGGRSLPHAQFLTAALLTFAVADLTETYLNAGHGWHWLMLIGGAIYTGRFGCAPPANHRTAAMASASEGSAEES